MTRWSLFIQTLYSCYTTSWDSTLLAGIVSLAGVACGGDAEEEAAAPTEAAAQPQLSPTAVVTPTPEPTRPAGAGITNRDGNVVEMTLTIVGGGGTTEPKSNTYGAVPFQWFPNEMTFKVGDTVNFTIIPTEDKKQQHRLVLRDLGVGQYIKYGNTAYLTHTFDKPGTFRFICEVHAYEGMDGEIIVQ